MISKSKIKGKMIILLKPNTFMNLSGKAINYWIKKEKILFENILIVTDDLNLPFGKLRLRSKGNDGGHNGLKDIQDKLNSTNYSRLRFGIKNKVKIENKVDYVIGKWTKNESELLEQKIISSFILSGVNITMNEFNNN
jgi:PTH1 family peptidyl-tRNA hydrolase